DFHVTGVQTCALPILSSLLILLVEDVPLAIITQRTFSGINSFSLMAVPFFILAGNVMQGGGIARRLMDFANALVGWFRGGIGARSEERRVGKEGRRRG